RRFVETQHAEHVAEPRGDPREEPDGRDLLEPKGPAQVAADDGETLGDREARELIERGTHHDDGSREDRGDAGPTGGPSRPRRSRPPMLPGGDPGRARHAEPADARPARMSHAPRTVSA